MTVVTSDSITRSGLFTQAYWNVFNLVNNRSNVVDPHTNGSSGKRSFVYSREPEVNGLNFAGYPFIILHPVRVSQSRHTLGRTTAQVDWSVLIEVRNNDTFAREKPGIDPVGRGLAQLDSVSDDVFETFNSETNKNTMETYGMYFVNPEVTSEDTINLENETVYVREIELRFRNALLTVSA